jgi:hypothetical protein
VSNLFGNLQSFFPEGSALNEHAELGMTRGKGGKGEHSGQVGLPKALSPPFPTEGRQRLPVAIYGLTIVALGRVGDAQGLVRHGVEDDIPTGHGKPESTLASSDGLGKRAPLLEMA